MYCKNSSCNRIQIYETQADFQILNLETGDSTGMGDGVGMFCDSNEEEIPAGSPEFYNELDSCLDDHGYVSMLVEAYFPELELAA
jgi:hypothetical protein